MSEPPQIIKSLKEIGGVFKFGSGVLGKSAIALGVLLVAAVVAVFRLQSDIAIVLVFVLAALVFFLWFFPVIKFAGEHPDVALLEGSQWTGWKRFEASAKFLPKPGEKEPTIAPESPAPTPPEIVEGPDKEPNA